MPAPLFALLILSVWLNYLDRGYLGIAAPHMQKDFAFSPTQLGLIFSAFFWSYALLQPLAGWLVDRYHVFRLYGYAFGLWALAALASGLAPSFAFLFLSRLLLGAAESLAYPAYSRMLASSFAESRRGYANAMIDVASKGGPALGTSLGALALAHYGWRPFYWLLGAMLLVWLFFWQRAVQAAPLSLPSASGRTSLAWMQTRAAAATFLGLFCFNYAFYFLSAWLPIYLLQERHFTMSEMATFSALPYGATALSSFAIGLYADHRVRRGAASGPLRRRLAVLGLLLAAAPLLGVTLPHKAAALSCLLVSFLGMGLFTANIWAITQTLAGPQRAGSWTGWQNACGNLGGVVAPLVTAWCMESGGGFLLAFAIATALLFAAAGFYGLLLPVVQEVSRHE